MKKWGSKWFLLGFDFFVMVASGLICAFVYVDFQGEALYVTDPVFKNLMFLFGVFSISVYIFAMRVCECFELIRKKSKEGVSDGI